MKSCFTKGLLDRFYERQTAAVPQRGCVFEFEEEDSDIDLESNPALQRHILQQRAPLPVRSDMNGRTAQSTPAQTPLLRDASEQVAASSTSVFTPQGLAESVRAAQHLMFAPRPPRATRELGEHGSLSISPSPSPSPSTLSSPSIPHAVRRGGLSASAPVVFGPPPALSSRPAPRPKPRFAGSHASASVPVRLRGMDFIREE
jgi:hypothetical protein